MFEIQANLFCAAFVRRWYCPAGFRRGTSEVRWTHLGK